LKVFKPGKHYQNCISEGYTISKQEEELKQGTFLDFKTFLFQDERHFWRRCSVKEAICPRLGW
jgi:hypothetical protein